MRKLFCVLLLLWGWGLAGAQDAVRPLPRAQEVGLVLLHGKWGRPPAPQAQRFADLGFQVVSPEMGWSRAQGYGIGYADSLAGVHAAVQGLRARGVRTVIVGGQSFGANGALAYAARYNDADGLILFAPGHNPDIDRNRDMAKVARAREMVARGQGGEPLEFTDHNDGGRTQLLSVPAAHYLSYFDPEGLASMPRSAQALTRAIPVIVFMGRSDFVTRQGKGYFFDRLPPHPASLYRVSPADHREVPAASFDDTLAWLEANFLR